VIHDDDNNKDEHVDLNQLIQSSKHAKLTLSIHVIAQDVESFLNIPSAGSDHRKPQHVLFLYSEGKIDSGKLAAFCALVEGCLPQPAAPAAIATASLLPIATPAAVPSP
jgi:hypothetical protein